MPPNSGVNRYELKELLGEGGMGVVYRAFDTRTKTYVALKTLRDEADPTMLEMFKREWALLGEVPHVNIVDIRDVDEIEINGVRKPCFIMPLLPGCTLAALIKSASPRVTTEFVVNMVAQVCKGLQAAHEKGLVHRDLKPSNIFIMEDDSAKIIDFGLVHTVGNKSTTGLKGTWQYMAPEQIDGSKQPSRAFDIFSLGVVAYEALTGHQPFKRAKFEDTAEAVRYFVPQAISERNPKVPVMVGKAVHIAMAKQPNSRYTTAREFADTIQKAFRNEYIERFDPAKIRPRIDRAKKAFSLGDSEFASEILTELEAEGNLDADITLLRAQIDEFNKQKRVRQLYEAAQTRLEQDEIPLALEKLQEILKIDPQNSEAFKLRKKIEQQRSQQQVAEWLDLARKHLDRHDFSEARRALKEVFNLKYDDPEAAALKTQVDAREKEVETARAEKENLYGSALRHNNNGEISSALSKLERLLELSRNTPGASVPERDKVFQAFYNDVRTERDRVENAYSEGNRHLAEKNFDKALGICDGILFKYPQHAQFQALRLKIEHSQRQELSAYIAEVGRAVETEPNLDRRVGLLEEACKRYPNEAQFSRQLSLAKELQALVKSIVARVADYEENNQFAEAITQWNTLANIHPQYPGIDFEISTLQRRREQQIEEDKKARFVERIDRALSNNAFADAEALSNEALAEFPANPELTALLRLSRQGLDRTREANRLFEEAKVQRSAGDLDQAVALLRQALGLDKGNIVVQNTLVNLLTERALATLDSDLAAAETYAAEAAHLDPEHPAVHKVTDLIAQAKRKRYVEQTVLQARELQNAHRNQAIDILKQGLTVYPNDGRLQQTLSNLQKDEPHAAFGATAFGLVTEEKTVVYPNNGAAVQQPPVPSAAPPVRPLVTPPRTTGFVPSAKQQQQQQASQPKPEPPKPEEQSKGSSVLKKTREASAVVAGNIKEKLGSGPNTTLKGVIIGLVASVIAIALGYWYLNRPTGSGPLQPQLHSRHQVKLNVTPSDAVVLLDGSPVGAATPLLEDGSTHHISVSRAGYKTMENPAIKASGSEWAFALPLEPLQLSVSVSDNSGTVWVDDQQIDKFEDGIWSSSFPLNSPREHHVLSVKNKSGNPLFQVAFTAVPGQPVAVEPVQTKDLLITSTFGKDVIVYAGNPSASVLIPNQQPQPLSPQGVAFKLEDPSGAFSIATGKRTESRTLPNSSAPALGITLNAQVNAVRATVSVTPKNAKLYVDGGLVPHPHNGVYSWLAAARTYDAKLTADGMEDMKFSIALKKGTEFVHHYDMKPKESSTSGATSSNSPTLVINDGEPGGTVSVLNGPVLGILDAKGNGRFSTAPGAYSVEISKPGHTTNGFAVNMAPGKEFELKGEKKLLKVVPGHLRVVSIRPSNAVVTYFRKGESEVYHATLGVPITLAPGVYQFSADADKFLKSSFEVAIDANGEKAITFDLQPINTAQQKPFVSPDFAKKVNGDWFHGNINGFIPLQSEYHLNTILWSNSYKIKKVAWRVYLDNDNMITYTLDSKALSIVRRINGVDAPDKIRDVDFTSTETSAAYAVKIHLEHNGVTASSQKGGAVVPTTDSKHDWSQAKLQVKGDSYFTFWQGR